jgi:Transposase DDE domain group 1
MDPAVTRAITEIPADAWTPIKYAHAIFDDQENRWVSDAQVAEIGFTAFTSHKKSEHIGARLIVRRVKRLNPTTVPAGQGELFSTWRHHAVFTDSAEPMLAAEATHRDHAIVEQVIADLKAGPLARMPSGRINANAAWLILATIAFNLTRAAGTLASRFHAKATTATIRAQLITVPARIARSARRTRLHLPQHWPWEDAWQALLTAASGPPAAAT